MKTACIIPNLNNGSTLARCLDSAFAQTRPFDRVIVVDGFSTDESVKIGATYLHLPGSYPIFDSNGNVHVGATHRYRSGFSWIGEVPRGIAHARNLGIEAARDCEWIVPLDADDWIEPNYVERCLGCLTSDEIGIIAPALRWPGGRVQYPTEPITRSALLTGNRLFTCSMFRREAWERAGGYPTEPGIFEDWLLWGKIVTLGYSVAIVREPLYHYCPHVNGSTAKMHHRNAEYVRRTIEKLRAYAS